MPIYTFVLREVERLEGTGVLPVPSAIYDAAIKAGLIGLSTPRGLYLKDAGRKMLADGDVVLP